MSEQFAHEGHCHRVTGSCEPLDRCVVLDFDENAVGCHQQHHQSQHAWNERVTQINVVTHPRIANLMHMVGNRHQPRGNCVFRGTHCLEFSFHQATLCKGCSGDKPFVEHGSRNVVHIVRVERNLRTTAGKSIVGKMFRNYEETKHFTPLHSIESLAITVVFAFYLGILQRIESCEHAARHLSVVEVDNSARQTHRQTTPHHTQQNHRREQWCNHHRPEIYSARGNTPPFAADGCQ